MKLIAAIMLVAVIIFGASYSFTTSGAWFNDSESLQPVDVTSGILSPFVNSMPFSVTNAEPGVTAGTQDFFVTNAPWTGSTINAKYRITPVFDSGPAEFCHKIWVKAEHEIASGQMNVAYEGMLVDMVLGPDQYSPTGHLKASPDSSEHFHMWHFTYTPHESMGNAAQGKTCSFHLVIDFTQAINPGWGE